MARLTEDFLRELYTKEKFSDILNTLKAGIKQYWPEWTDHLSSDFGICLLEMFAGILAYMRFMQNVTAVESFPSLARLRESLFRHAKWFAYTPKPAGAARTTLQFTVENPAQGATIPRGTRVATSTGDIIFETIEPLVIPAGQTSGTVGAIHAHLIKDEIIGLSDGSKNQRYQLQQSPLVVLPAEDSDEEEFAITLRVDGEEWTQVRSLVWASELGGAESKAFKVEIEPDDTAYVVFGDGLFGDIPPAGAEIVVDYWIGGGEAGNVGAGTLTELAGNIANVASVTNLEAATGGHDRETEEELRKNIPSQVITRGRAVTREDYRRLLEAFAEVAKVNIRHPQENVVEVYVLPQGGGLPSDELKEKLADYLDNIRMITEDVRILDPTLVGVDITARIWVDENYDASEVAGAVVAALREEIGEPEFARQLYPSDIYRIIQAQAGLSLIHI